MAERAEEALAEERERENKNKPDLTAEQKILVSLVEQIKAMEKEQEAIKEFLAPDKFNVYLTNGLRPLVESIKAHFDQIDASLKQSPQQSGNGLMDFLGGLGKAIGKGIENRVTGAGSGSPGSGWALDMERMMQDMLKMDLKEMVSSRRRSLGLPQQVEHVVLSASTKSS
jgi:hypothetical protein